MQTSETKKAPVFIADCHLGKLAKYLRFMGFDTLYFPQIEDNALIDLANEEERTILTRDRGLFERKKAECFLITSHKTQEQLLEVIKSFALKKYRLSFSRCIVCNTPLQSIDKQSILYRLPPKVISYFSHFEICKQCDRIYWHGDHYRHMKAFLQKLLASV